MAQPIISSGTEPSLFVEGTKAFIQAEYDRWETIYDKIFETVKSEKQFERYVPLYGMTVDFEKPEGMPINYQGFGQLPPKDLKNLTFANGFQITMEAQADNLYQEVATLHGSYLAQAAAEGKELRAHKILNEAFSTVSPKGSTGGDGVCLCSASHPSPAGNRSNVFPTAPLCQATVQDAYVQVKKIKNNSGQRIKLMPETWIVPAELEPELWVILNSPKLPGTLNNDMNSVFNGANYRVNVIGTPYLDNPTYYFLKVKGAGLSGKGLIHQQRLPFTPGNDKDNGGTMNALFFAYERYVFGWQDFMQIFGSPGQ